MVPAELASEARKKGGWAEDLAAEYLSGKSFAILDRNYRISQGEIDIIAKDGNTLVFVEVKYLSDPEKAYFPEEQLTFRKQRCLVAAANSYLGMRRHEGPCRFDVLAISRSAGGGPCDIRHITDAFEA